MNTRKIVRTLTSLFLVLSICVIPSLAANVSTQAEAKISNELREKLMEPVRKIDQTYPVQIFLNDTLDYEAIEQQAQAKADAVLASAPVAAQALDSEAAARDLEAQAMETYRQDRIHSISQAATAINQGFLARHDFEVESVSLGLTEIPLAYLSESEILEAALDPAVVLIDATQNYEVYNTTTYSISSVNSCIGATSMNDTGYKGSGIKIGIIELDWADCFTSGPNLTNVGGPYMNATNHADLVAIELRQIAPDAQKYLRKVDTATTDALDGIEYLITNYNVNVVNLSLGFDSKGEYTTASRRLDRIIRQYKVPVVTTAGNYSTGNNFFVNGFGLAPNAITVGSVCHNGNTTASSSAYTFSSSFSCYVTANGAVLKPDVCAPGELLSIGPMTEQSGTSFASPWVTGTVALMMECNSGLTDKPETVKAGLVASCTYTGGSSYATNLSQKEGAGVINTNFACRVAINGRRTHKIFFATAESSQTHEVYADYTNKPFRVAIAWDSQINNAQQNVWTDYDLYIYKNGTLVAYSANAPRNTEVAVVPVSVLQQYGAGYYTAKIVRSGTAQTDSDQVGLAWEQ